MQRCFMHCKLMKEVSFPFKGWGVDIHECIKCHCKIQWFCQHSWYAHSFNTCKISVNWYRMNEKCWGIKAQKKTIWLSNVKILNFLHFSLATLNFYIRITHCWVGFFKHRNAVTHWQFWFQSVFVHCSTSCAFIIKWIFHIVFSKLKP